MTTVTISSDKVIKSDILSDKHLNLQILDSSGNSLIVENSPVYTLGVEQYTNIINIEAVSLELTLYEKEPLSVSVDSKESTYEFTQNFIAGIKGDKGETGAQGIQGFSGSTESALASDNILAYKMVKYNSTGKLEYCSSNLLSDINTLVGISLNSGVENSSITYQMFGSIENPSWNFPINSTLFLGLGGEITTQQVGTFSQIIGHTESTTKIFLKIGRCIIRG